MTTLKKMTVLSAWVLGLTLAFGTVAVPQAKAWDSSCFAEVKNAEGEWKGVKVERRAMQYLVWKKLIVTFQAPYHDGGSSTVSGTLALLDADTKNIIESWTLSIQDQWRFNVETETEFGPVRIACTN